MRQLHELKHRFSPLPYIIVVFGYKCATVVFFSRFIQKRIKNLMTCANLELKMRQLYELEHRFSPLPCIIVVCGYKCATVAFLSEIKTSTQGKLMALKQHFREAYKTKTEGPERLLRPTGPTSQKEGKNKKSARPIFGQPQKFLGAPNY